MLACFTATMGQQIRGSVTREGASQWRNVQAPGVGTLRDIACSRMSVVGPDGCDLLSFVIWSVMVSCKEEFSQDAQD